MNLRVDGVIRWTLEDDAELAPGHPVEDVDPPPPFGSNSRGGLAAWWQWRYAALLAENVRLDDLIVQVLGESQSYRALLQSAFDALHEQKHQHDSLREQHRRLRDEYQSHRERVLRDEHRHGRGTAA